MASPLAPVTEDVKTGFDKFQPETAQDMIQFFGEFPEFFEALASSLGGLAGRMESEMPLDPGLAETMREFAGTIAGLRDQASEMNRQFRQVHAKEIERIEEPRPGEQAWDVGAQ